MPSELFRADKTGLGALSYQDGALPPFQHHFYVDSTPRITDVNFGGGNPIGTRCWSAAPRQGRATIYYALDVSDPASITDETTAAQKVLWHSPMPTWATATGRPIIAKTHAFGGSKWVVIVAARLQQPDRQGQDLHPRRHSDGSLLKTLVDRRRHSDEPRSGLAQIASVRKDFRNQFAEQIYGGDLLR